MPARKISVIDIATAVVLAAAVYLLAQPGSAIRTPIERKVSEVRRSRAVDASWATLVSAATPLGSDTQQPVIIEFSDYECPFCRSMNSAVDSAVAAGAKIAYVHFPLPIHKSARRASLVAMCARKIGAFDATHHYFMTEDAWQTDTAWSKLAIIGPHYMNTSFTDCLRDPSTTSALDAQVALGKELKLTGTPSLISQQESVLRAVAYSDLMQLATRN